MQRTFLMAESSWRTLLQSFTLHGFASRMHAYRITDGYQHNYQASLAALGKRKSTQSKVVEDGEGGGGISMVRMTKSMHGRLVV